MWHFSSTNFFGKTFVSVQCIVLRTLTSSILKLFREEWKENCDWNFFWSLLIWMHRRWLCNLTTLSVCVTNSWMINENRHKKKMFGQYSVRLECLRTNNGKFKAKLSNGLQFFFKSYSSRQHIVTFFKRKEIQFLLWRERKETTHTWNSLNYTIRTRNRT